jgi:hypothetical protein
MRRPRPQATRHRSKPHCVPLLRGANTPWCLPNDRGAEINIPLKIVGAVIAIVDDLRTVGDTTNVTERRLQFVAFYGVRTT